MDKKEAKALIDKLINASFLTGQHSSNPDSLIFKSEEKKALRLADEIAHLLIIKKCCVLCPQSRQGKCGIDEDLDNN